MPAGESEVRARTRERFNEVFKKYSDSEKKKSKKKSAEVQETIVLQNLKKNLNLEKDTEEDETILQNTYDPAQGSPRYTKNKRREKETAEKININNSKNQEEAPTPKGKKKSKRELPSLPPEDTSYIQNDTDASKSEIALEPDDVGGGKEPKRKSKRGKSKGDTEAKAESQVEDAEDKLLHEYQQQIAQEEERTSKKKSTKSSGDSVVSQTVPLNNDVGKKKKKKLKSVITQSEVGDEDEDADQDADVDNEAESKGKKKKKKKKHVVKEESDTEAEVPQKPTFDDSLVLGVYIHRTDRLKTDLLISHPMVKIHVIDENTGQYVKKEDCHRPVSSFYEQENVDHIIPIMTQPFDFKKNKSIIPEWREQIIFNERFGYFVEQNDDSPRVVLLFEILDFITMEEARANVDVDKHERGFRKIAWAFLKLVGTNSVLNIDSKLRLQLFCPPPRAKRQPKTIEVVEWWRKYPRNKYASTLYVTVKGIKLPEHVDPCIRSMMALQEERGSTSYSELQNEVNKRSLMQPLHSKPPPLRWSRLPGQVCRIPNKSMQVFRGGKMGCFAVLFSHAGTILATACADRDAFPVIVYEIPSGKVLAEFIGHLKIVYDLCWSRDDRSLLSASSDGTVREWNVERLQQSAQKVLPHPSFVYCAQYHPTAQNLVVSGGYDSLLRVWRVDVDEVNGQLLQELEGHNSFINSICFDSEGRRMFSADNTGLILVWKTTVTDSRRHQPCHRWCIEKKIDEIDLGGIPVTMLQLHPNGRCLLIHAKDSVLRMMDLRILAVKKYTGATNYRERIYSTFTPCGNFIFSGSEDGMAYVWNTDTGDQVAVYSELCYSTALHGVAFHPHENMVAFSAFGQFQPVHVYLYDRKVSQLEAHTIKAASRLSSTDTKTIRNTPDTPALQDTSAAATIDQFAQATRLALKMQCVKEQLDSVLDPHQRSSASGYMYEQDKMSITHSGRSFTTDSVTTGLNASLPPPSLLSPHSKLQLSGPLAEQLIPQAALSAQNRGFSPVGQRLKGASSFRLQTSLPDHISSGIQETDSAPVQQVVVSLYDYRANRSDELTIRRGDVIQVLYKDNDNWWFGRLANGQQGYFLASYVADQRDFSEEVTQSVEAHAALSEGTVERSTPTRVSAAISSSGELRFLSEPTLSDTEPELTDARARRKKKVKKSGVPAPSSQATFSDADAPVSMSTRRRGRSADRPLPKRPTGRTNGAFEPDT
ncbi:jouberin [Epinephelus fuscoguttatus]|uniref:jouberin n=1 Tax=Epinephelus fuscoguttatus TaxID=293821 RepID=UPI0020D17579|nr:jouberin [Epinephelus fuscoguttatus]XP_049451488.1 jouberin [Epinephelus fuscoguttatus]XP_049451489.1 jouberin [Epinephelus fuscoguttatus]XP_049451490.1 jouberin [Epinephelus fuscoguttatus]XP_049451492.1 jouberin [Epinephelus fuscoguttatus]